MSSIQFCYLRNLSVYQKKKFLHALRAYVFTQTSACDVVGDRGYFVESSNDAIEVKKKGCNKLSSVAALLLTP